MTKFVQMTDAMRVMSVPNILRSLTFTEKNNFVFINKVDQPLNWGQVHHDFGRWPLEENTPEYSLFQAPIVSPDPASGLFCANAEIQPPGFTEGATLGIANNCRSPGPYGHYLDMKRGAEIGCAMVYSTDSAPSDAYVCMDPMLIDTTIAGYCFAGVIFKRGATTVWTFHAIRLGFQVWLSDNSHVKVPFLDHDKSGFTF